MLKLNHIIKTVLLILILSLGAKSIQAQIPVNDAGWILQTYSSEDFNSTLDTVNKWHTSYPWGNYGGGAEMEYPCQLIHPSGATTLKIEADTLIPNVTQTSKTWNPISPNQIHIAYKSGALVSRVDSLGHDRYKFGYLETYIKCPTSYYALWYGPWLWSASCSGGYYNEIDILENPADFAYVGTKMGTNVHLYDTIYHCNPDSTKITDDAGDVSGLPLLSAAFHKVAVQWAPDRVIWYFDDTQVRSIYDPTGERIPQETMAFYLTFQISPYYAFLPADWVNAPHTDSLPTNYPQDLVIDYLHYYKLNTDCSNPLTICSPGTDYSTRAVKKSITTGGACSPTFNPSNTSGSYTLRATDYILLDAGTTVDPTGTGYFTIETMACPQ